MLGWCGYGEMSYGMHAVGHVQVVQNSSCSEVTPAIPIFCRIRAMFCFVLFAQRRRVPIFVFLFPFVWVFFGGWGN